MNARYTLDELQIGIDVGSINHAIAIAKEDGTILQEFEISHNNKGFDSFFQIVDKLSSKYHAKVGTQWRTY